MRNIIRCDICCEEANCDKGIFPTGFSLVDSLDLCKSCGIEYNKRRRKVIKDMAKEKEKKK